MASGAERFAAERVEIAAIVRERVCGQYRRRAADGGRSLAAVIDAVAATLLAGSGEGRDDRAAVDWRAMPRDAVGLERAVGFFLDDIQTRGGGFDLRAYRLVIACLPAALRFAFGARDPLAARLAIDGPLDEIRALAARGTLVIAPTHSSNLDSLVLGHALARSGLPPCLYAAAKHMYRNPLVAGLVTRLGGFRVDRTLQLDLYNDVIAEYATVLLQRGYHLTIFPGATRCRTNEVERSLRLGLLRSAMRAARRGRPAWIVPVAISYQVVLEAEWLMRYHLAGRGAERIVGDELLARGRLAASARRLWELDQRVAVRFGAPIDPGNGRHLPLELTSAYRRATVVFATQLVARAVWDLAPDNPALDDRARVEQLAGFAAPVRAIEAALDGLAATFRMHPEAGSLDRSVDGVQPAAVIEAALAAWRGCHRGSVLVRAGDQLVVGDPGLVYFYRNRTNHLVT